MLRHPDGPVEVAMMAVEGRADASLMEVVAIATMLAESEDDPAVVAHDEARSADVRRSVDGCRHSVWGRDWSLPRDGRAYLAPERCVRCGMTRDRFTERNDAA